MLDFQRAHRVLTSVKGKSSAKILRAAFESLDSRLLLSGNLDTTFNGTGSATSGAVIDSGPVVAVAERADGSRFVLSNLLVQTPVSSIYGAAGGFELSQLNAAGQTQGTPFVFNILGGVSAATLIDAEAVTGGSVTGFYVVGTAYRPLDVGGTFENQGEFVIVHVTDSGTLDTSFGGGRGYETYDIGGSGDFDVAYSAGMDGSGRIVVGGTYQSSFGASPEVAFLRVQSDGTPTAGFGSVSSALSAGAFYDPSYGSDFTISAGPNTLAVASDGSFYLGYSSPGAAGFQGYDSTGAGASGFGVSGSAPTVPAIALGGTNVYMGVIDGGAAELYVVSRSSGNSSSVNLGPLLGESSVSGLALQASSGAITIAAQTGSDGLAIAQLVGSGAVNNGFNGGSPILVSSGNVGVPSLSVVPGGNVFVAFPLFGTTYDQGYEYSAAGSQLQALSSIGVGTNASAAPTTASAVAVSPDGSTLTVLASVNPQVNETLTVVRTDRAGTVTNTTVTSGSFSTIEVGGVVRLGDGSYVVVFSAYPPNSDSDGTQICLGFYNSDGSLNTSVGSGGFIAGFPNGADLGWYAKAATLDAAGTGILVAGVTDSGAKFLTQYALDGSVDTTFGSGGTVLVGNSGAAYLSLAVDAAHGRIFAGGNSEVDAYTSAGVLDTTWGSGGVATINGGNSLVTALSVYGSGAGRLYVGGSESAGDGSRKYIVTALNLTTGAADPSFNGGALLTSAVTGSVLSAVTGIAVDTSSNDGSIIVVGSDANAPFVARFTAAGVLDGGYAAGFTVGQDLYGEFEGVALDAAGRALIVGQQELTSGVVRTGVVYRFTPDVETAPVVQSVTFAPTPKAGDATGQVTVVFAAHAGLAINVDALAGAITYVRPDESTGSAALLRYRIVDALGIGQEVEAVYSYTASTGTFQGSQDGTYAFSVVGGVVGDELGNFVAAAAIGSAAVTTTPTGRGDPSAGFGGTGQVTSGSVAVTAGTFVQSLVSSDGFTYVLSNLPAISISGSETGRGSATGGLMITRYTVSGALDGTFGNLGRFIFTEGLGFTAARLLDLGPGNGVMVAGTAYLPNPTSPLSEGNALADFALVKVTSAGGLDGTFNGMGYRNYDLSNGGEFAAGFDDYATSAAVDPSGRIVVTGTSQSGSTLFLRVLSDGTPDASFGSVSMTALSAGAFALPGFVSFSPSGTGDGLVADASGIYIAGRQFGSGGILKLTSGGALSTTFGSGGFATMGYGGSVFSALALGGGYVYAAGSFSGGVDLLVTRASSSTGAMDSTYGTSGQIQVSGAFGAPSLALDGGGNAVLAAVSLSGGTPNVAMVWTFLSDGSMSPSFNSGAALTLSFPTALNGPLSLSVASGRYRVAGPAAGVTEDSIDVAAITAAGSLDATFSASGDTPGQLTVSPAANAAPEQAVGEVVNGDGSVFTVSLAYDASGNYYLIGQLSDRNGVLIQSSDISLGNTSVSATGTFVDAQGNYLTFLVIGTGEGAHLYAARFQPSGALDGSFGTGGLMSVSSLTATVTLTASAASADGSTIYLAGYTTNGALIYSYYVPEPGVTEASLSGPGLPTALAVDPSSGQLYVARYSSALGSTISRYSSGVSIDTTWGTGGTVALAADSGGTLEAQSLAVDSSSGHLRVLVGGSIDYGDGTGGRFLFAYTAAAVLDASFAGDGQIIQDTGGFLDTISGIAVDPFGGYIVVGSEQNRPWIDRFDVNGNYDPSYARAFNPSPGAYGTFAGVQLDAAGRPIAYGQVVGVGGGLQPAVAFRFRASTIVAPTLGTTTPTAPYYTDTQVSVSVVLTPATGLLIDPNTLLNAVTVTGPGGSSGYAVPGGVVDNGDGTFTVTFSYSLGGATAGTAQGTYTFTLGGNTIADEEGTPIAGSGQTLGVVNATFSAVTATVAPVSPPRYGDSSYTFVVHYVPGVNQSLDSSTISGSNIVAFLGGSPYGTVAESGYVSNDDGSVDVTYVLTPPNGTFGISDNGTINLQVSTASPVRDGQGSPASGDLASLTLNYVAPTLVTTGFATPPLGASSMTFTLTFTPKPGGHIDASTIHSDSVVATLGGQAYGTLSLVSVSPPDSSGAVTATYTLTAPSGAISDRSGTLEFAFASNVTDVEGTPVMLFTSGASPQPTNVIADVSLSYVPPTVTATSFPTPPYGATSTTLTLLYSPNPNSTPGATIDASTISAGNVLFTLNGSPFGTVSVMSVVPLTGTNNVLVTYTLTSSAGAFSSLSGTLSFSTSSGSPVRDSLGVAAASVGQGILLNYTAPSTTVGTVPTVHYGDASLSFAVTYAPAPGRSVNAASIAGSNVAVTLGGASFGTVTVGSVVSSGGSVTVTYVLTPTGGSFGFATNGALVASFTSASPVTDDKGTPVAPGQIFTQALAFAAVQPSLTAPAAPKLGDASFTFQVSYTAGAGRTLGSGPFTGATVAVNANGNVSVLTPTSFAGSGQTVTFTYTFPAPNGAFGNSDAGNYSFIISSNNTLVDDVGDPVTQGAFGSFSLSFTKPSASIVGTLAPPPFGGAGSFTVRYVASPTASFAAADFTGSEVRVTTGPNATVVHSTIAPNGVTTDGSGNYLVTYLYYADANTSGTPFGFAQVDQAYTFSVVGGSISDSNEQALPAATLGSITVGAYAGSLNSVTAPTGSYVPGQNIFPSVSLTNTNSNYATQAFTVRFSILLGSTPTLLGSFTVPSVAAGATVLLSPPVGVPLLSSVALPPGRYTIQAQVFDGAGNAVGSAMTSATQVTVIATPQPRPGTLDPTFGGGSGQVTTFVPTVKLTLVGSVSEQYGTTAAAGSYVYSGGYNSVDGNYVLLRFLPNGSLDTSFGTNGVYTVNIGGTDVAAAFVADPQQGRMILAGTSVINGQTVFSVVRFTSAGALDASFGTNGVLTYVPGGSSASQLRGVSADAFGRLYLLGDITPTGGTAGQGVIIRLSQNGLVDTSFGALGVVSAAMNGSAPGVLPLTDGSSDLTSLLLLGNRILVGGTSGAVDGSSSRYVVAALTYGGTLDRTFGTKGLYLGPLGSEVDRVTVLSQPTAGGQIYVGGSHATSSGGDATAVVFRLTASGRLDRGFNKGQVLLLSTGTAFSTVSSMLPSVNNTLLVTVATANSVSSASSAQIGTVIFRLTTTGANDPFFNGGSPLLVVAVPAVTNALVALAQSQASSNFDAFLGSKQGAATIVIGGNIRAIAANPVTGGTSLTIAQLSADGFDLTPLLVANVPSTLSKLPYKGTAKVSISNVGSLVANGKFSVTLVAGPSATNLLSGSSAFISARLAPGTTRTFTLSFALPKTLTPGTYTLNVTLGNTVGGQTDANVANNSSQSLSSFTIPGASTAAVVSSLWSPLPGLSSPTDDLFSQESVLA